MQGVERATVGATSEAEQPDTQRRAAIRARKEAGAASRKEATIRRQAERRAAQARTREAPTSRFTEVAAMQGVERATVGATSEAEQPDGETVLALSICLSCRLCLPIMCNDTNERQIVTLSQYWHLTTMHAVEKVGANGGVEQRIVEFLEARSSARPGFRNLTRHRCKMLPASAN